MSSNDAIARLDAAAGALGDVDVSGWDDAALRGHLDELSTALCHLDAQLSRVADAVRARGFRITEPPAASPPSTAAEPPTASEPPAGIEPPTAAGPSVDGRPGAAATPLAA
jgi:hypothetical protein